MCRGFICLISFVLAPGLAVDVAGGLEVKINFQPQTAQIPAGYLPDYGEMFADRGNGFSYGWDTDVQGGVGERNYSSDQRYDTLIEMQGELPITWEIEVPNGGYDVFLACGDPQYTDQISNFNVEGNILVDPDGRDNYDEYGVKAIVTDGRLTIQTMPGGAKRKVMFVHITRFEIFKAYGPVPKDGAIHPDEWVTLGWLPGNAVVSHNVYLGDNLNDVNDGTGDTFQGNQPDTSFIAGTAGHPYPDGLVPGKTYYWRIDEVNDVHPDKLWKGDVWRFTVPVQTAYDPDPPDGAEFIDLDVVLKWSAGFRALSHHLYFGTDEEAVVNGTTASPEYKGPETTTFFTPGALDKGKTYYWRVDEQDSVATHKGYVWTFTTVPNIPITDPNLLCWWKFEGDCDVVAIDYSGHDHHGVIQGASLAMEGRVGAALDFGGDGDYVVDEDAENYLNGLRALTVCMWIKCRDIGMYGIDRGFINCEEPSRRDWAVTMRYDRSGYRGGGVRVVKMGVRSSPPLYQNELESSNNVQTTEWQHVAMTWSSGEVLRFYVNGKEDTPTFNSLPSDANSAVTACTKLIVGKGGEDLGTTLGWNGLIDDVHIYNKVLAEDEIKELMRGESDLAWNASPANGSTPDLHRALPLSWSPGDWATQHDVYFGTDRNAVANADTSDTTGIYRGRQPLPAQGYTPAEGVEWGTGPYYWRIDEYNTDKTISKGRVWQFTVADFILVDDFEDYNNYSPDRVFQTWIDGLGYTEPLPGRAGNNTGAQVGNDIWNPQSQHYQGDIVETTIVHERKQSMPYYYDNNRQGFLKYSEAKMALSYPRCWTEQGVRALTLWFRGCPAGFKEGPAGTYTLAASGADIWSLADEFRYACKQLSGAGSISAQVLSVQNTNDQAKAGVMIRRTLDPSSPFAAVYITPGNGCRFQGRLSLTAEATSDASAATPEQRAIRAPYWVKIERDGSNNFNGYYSSDGVNWHAMAWNPQNIPMPTNVYIGLALTSHNANAVCKAQFSGVKTAGSVTPATWTNEVIGTTMPSNDPEPMYVAIANKTGKSAVVYHNDSSAAQTDTWTQWNIDLKDFAGQGVNLTDVNSIAIGLGRHDNPQAGGSGLMYFDDVRLYRPRCVPDKLNLSQADLNKDCVVDLRDLDMMADDWLTSGPAANPNADGMVDFKDYAVLADQWLEEKLWP
jgi:hypothetical protein